ncbi:MAG: hypothetical protein ABWZ98_11245 [Nakamurella sp.]
MPSGEGSPFGPASTVAVHDAAAGPSAALVPVVDRGTADRAVELEVDGSDAAVSRVGSADADVPTAATPVVEDAQPVSKIIVAVDATAAAAANRLLVPGNVMAGR